LRQGRRETPFENGLEGEPTRYKSNGMVSNLKQTGEKGETLAERSIGGRGGLQEEKKNTSKRKPLKGPISQRGDL